MLREIDQTLGYCRAFDWLAGEYKDAPFIRLDLGENWPMKIWSNPYIGRYLSESAYYFGRQVKSCVTSTEVSPNSTLSLSIEANFLSLDHLDPLPRDAELTAANVDKGDNGGRNVRNQSASNEHIILHQQVSSK